jgi:hypothetical protein
MRSECSVRETPTGHSTHVDDLLIVNTSTDMIDHLTNGLKSKYGVISTTQGGILSQPGEARVSMKGYVQDLLEPCAVTGGARTPATDSLFEARQEAEMASEARESCFTARWPRYFILQRERAHTVF